MRCFIQWKKEYQAVRWQEESEETGKEEQTGGLPEKGPIKGWEEGTERFPDPDSGTPETRVSSVFQGDPKNSPRSHILFFSLGCPKETFSEKRRISVLAAFFTI
jgi:hypothetical protein